MNVLITGITGSLGKTVTEILSYDPTVKIFGLSRDELKQSEFPHRDKVTLILGDIRDQTRVMEVSRNMGLIYHFAAMKHVDLAEKNPEESIATNVIGTMNVMHAQRVNKIPRVVMASTDKAAYPVNVYGACKLIAERLVLRNQNNVVCRYGNVLASRGSVVPKFVESFQKEEKAFVTDMDMSRFWIRLEDAAKFVIDSAHGSGGLKIPNMKGAKVIDVAVAVSEIMGVPPRIGSTPIRPGEKLAECLKTKYDGLGEFDWFSDKVDQFTDSELNELLAPIVKGLL